MPKVPQEKKVRIKDDLLRMIKRARNKSTKNKTIYSSDKQFVEIAIINQLKKERMIK